MRLSRKKYNFAIILLVIIIVSVIVFSAVEAVSLSGNTETSLPSITNPNIDITIAEENNNSENADTEVPEDFSVWKKIAKEQNGMAIINYSLDKLINGKGYKSNAVQIVSVDTPIGIVKQTVKVTNQKNSLYSCSVTQAFSSSSFAENFYRYEYIKDNKVYTRQTSNGTTFTNNDDVKTYDITDYKNKTNTIPCEFAFDLNSSNIKIVTFTQDKGKYKIEIAITNMKSAASRYIKQVEYNGGNGSNPRFSAITMVFTINPSTGYIESLNRTENYQISRNVPVLGTISPDCVSTVTETFSIMNKNFAIKLPE